MPLNRKYLSVTIAALLYAGASTHALATEHVYSITSDNIGAYTVTLNTDTNQITMIGDNINVSGTFHDDGQYNLGPTPSGMVSFDTITGSYSVNGKTVYPRNEGAAGNPSQPQHQAMLKFGFVNDPKLFNFWSSSYNNPEGTGQANTGGDSADQRGRLAGYSSPPPSSPPPTSTGGSNASSTGSSGTSVPAPGMIVLFGLGLAGLGLERRRRKLRQR